MSLFGLRVGSNDNDNDTVGVTMLLCKHVKLLDDSIVFDFLGKDSIRYN